jgi:hypothetical protein
MPLRIDHIVIGVRDLAQASADYTAAGFIVTPGVSTPAAGEHTTRSSRSLTRRISN